ncbi:PREDICTED: uncharacterized protein LOC108663710 isoform X4 [Theobroma cacao]|nr:PREDICTED: uncharacterized protein LOC108663710 isoform X4 [Theobroma cacao]
MAEKREDIERSIYIHVCRNLDAGSQSNAWYVINQRPEGAEIYPVFDDIPQLYPGGALADTNCEVVDSNLYVIGGWDSVKHTYTNVVRCLDTRNPSNGWKTCLTLPFACCGAFSAVCGEWMYVIGGDYQGYPIRSSRLPWGLVFNLDCKLEKLYTLRAPGVGEFPDASAAFLGGLLVESSIPTIWKMGSYLLTTLFSVNALLPSRFLILSRFLMIAYLVEPHHWFQWQIPSSVLSG